MDEEVNIVYYRDIKKVYDKHDNLISRDCSECKEHLLREEFPRATSKSYKDGIRGKCFSCTRKWFIEYEEENVDELKKYRQEYYKKNKVTINEKKRIYQQKNKAQSSKRHKNWRKKNKGHLKKYKRSWDSENREHLNSYKAVHTAKRRTFIKKLPFDLTSDEWSEIKKKFSYRCPITNSKDIVLEHFIPLSTGHGGTSITNCYPLDAKLNIKKYNQNPFEWVKKEIAEGNIEESSWNDLILYLAEMNELSIPDFRNFVDWCFNNKREVEDILDDTPSINIWMSKGGLQ